MRKPFAKATTLSHIGQRFAQQPRTVRGGRSRTKKSGWILGNADGGTKSRRAGIFSGGITGRPIADEEGRRHAEAAIREHHYLS